jgi:hypothetical protein
MDTVGNDEGPIDSHKTLFDNVALNDSELLRARAAALTQADIQCIADQDQRPLTKIQLHFGSRWTTSPPAGVDVHRTADDRAREAFVNTDRFETAVSPTCFAD